MVGGLILYFAFSPTAQRLSVGNYNVGIFPHTVLISMSQALPITRQEMLNIAGVTEAKYERFGQEFLNVTMTYATMLASE